MRTLVERYGATRAALFSSLARSDFGENSDIDIAADSLAGERFVIWLEEIATQLSDQ